MCSASAKGVFYERAFTGTLKKHLQIRLEWEGFSVCGWSYTCGRSLGGGVCSASVNRLSDQSSQTDGREHLKHDLISSS